MKNPAVWTVLGGPYASHRADQYISRGHSDLIVKGAGEDVFCRVLIRIRQDGNDFSDIPNLVYQNNEDTVETSADHSFGSLSAGSAPPQISRAASAASRSS